MIETNQELNLNNLLSFRHNLTQSEVQKIMMDIKTFIKKEGLSVVGPKISTTHSVNQTMIPTMDIDLLIPIDKQFTETDIYKLKEYEIIC